MSRAKSDKQKTTKQKTNNDFFCVGIGASAGGLEAIETFFKNLPEKTGMAYIIVQHLSPDYKSLMGELLARYTNLPIYKVEDGMMIERDSVYLIPPKKNMTIFGRRLFLNELEHKEGLNLPIDIFFRSLALDIGKNSIGVVLSGTGSDGAMGIKAIKEAGGMIMVQDENSAKFDGMPRSSIATGMVDYILPPNEMPKKLLDYVKHPYIVKSDKTPDDLSSGDTLLRILRIVRDRVGVDFTYYKPNTIVRRLEKRLGINQIENYSEYLEFLEQSPKEAQILYKDLLIGVTQFFRDADAFEIIKNEVIPRIIDSKSENTSLRVWTVGCSTGEEAYSIAILIAEYLEKINKSLEVKIFATDIDKDHVEIAGVGFYPESIVTDVSPERLEKYFDKKDNGYQVNEKIRRMVIYAQQNIIKDPPFSKIDMISCRNMLIYLNQEMQRKIISMFYYSLVPSGGLFLGSSESLGEMSDGFEVINNKWKIYRQKVGYKPPLITNYLMPLTRNIKPVDKNFDFRIGAEAVKKDSNLPDNILSDILERIMPASVILSEDFNILHVFGEVNDFIKLKPGKADFNILNLIRKELGVVMSSMLHKVMNDNKDVYFKDINLEGEKSQVNISAKALEDKISRKRFVLVSFEKVIFENKDTKKKFGEELDLGSEINQRYFEIEKELQFTKENLQATIEELETSNEELQSTNEELVASNEELQSTNEELQSVNEELYTVNTEYQKKIEELTQLNADMNNLLMNTDIGIVYLDKNLRIRKYTSKITKIINVMDMDIGRPIKHISINVDYPKFSEDIQMVLDTLKPKEVEIQDKQGNWSLVRILPYRTAENAVDGIAITLVDITNMVESEQKYKGLYNSMAQGVVNQDSKGKIISANPAAERILGLSLDQMMGRKSIDKRWKAIHEDGSDFPGDEHPSMVALKTGEKVLNQVMGVYHPEEKAHKWILVSAVPKFRKGEKKPYEVFATFEDITNQKNAEEELKRNVELMNRVLENSPTGKLVVDAEGLITYANKRAEDIMGVKISQIIKRKYNSIQWKILDVDGKQIPEEKLPFELLNNSKQEIRNYCMSMVDNNGQRRYIKVNASPMFDQEGQTEGGVFSIEEIDKNKTGGYKSWRDF